MEAVVAASLLIKVKVNRVLKTGNAVAISANRALTALHGCVIKNVKVTLITRSGRTLTGNLWSR